MRTPLGVARRMVATVASALVGVVVVALVLFPPGAEAEEPAALGTAVVLVAVGVAGGIGGVVWTRRRLLPCEDPAALRGAYVTSVLLGAAFAESPALVGFVATFLVASPWPALGGGVVAAILLWLVAPTGRELARRDAALAAAGCGTSLTAALQAPGDPPTRM